MVQNMELDLIIRFRQAEVMAATRGSSHQVKHFGRFLFLSLLSTPMAEQLLSPGVLFLVGSLPKLTLPSGIAYLAFNYLKLPRWVCIAASVSAGPVWFWVRSVYRHLLEEREIRALGAVRVPEVKGKWFGNLDLVVGRLKQGKDGYPCPCKTLVYITSDSD
jgi:hypothetical protein